MQKPKCSCSDRFIKKILTRMKAICRRNPLKAIPTSMHGPVEFVYIFETFLSDFIDFYVNKKKTLKKMLVFQFSLSLICLELRKNLRERAIGKLHAGMTMNAVAMNIGCSTRAIRHLRQRLQATERTEDRPRSGSPRVTTLGQDRYVRNTHQRKRFQTVTATAANTHGTHNNRISAKTVRNRLNEGGLSARRPYVGCILARRHRVNLVNWARTHQRWLRQQWNNVLFSDESKFTIHRGDGRVQVYRRRNDFCRLLQT